MKFFAAIANKIQTSAQIQIVNKTSKVRTYSAWWDFENFNEDELSWI